MHTRYRKQYPTNKKFVTTCARNTPHAKTELFQERQTSFVLASHYVRCLNASLSLIRCCKLILHLKLLILRKKNRANPVLITLYRPAHAQSRFKVYKTVLRLKKTGLSAWNLIGKSPKYTVLVFPHPKILCVGQPWWPKFLNTFSRLPKNS